MRNAHGYVSKLKCNELFHRSLGVYIIICRTLLHGAWLHASHVIYDNYSGRMWVDAVKHFTPPQNT